MQLKWVKETPITGSRTKTKSQGIGLALKIMMAAKTLTQDPSPGIGLVPDRLKFKKVD